MARMRSRCFATAWARPGPGCSPTSTRWEELVGSMGFAGAASLTQQKRLSLSLSLSLSLCVDSFVGCCSSSSSGGVWQDEQHRPRVAGLRQERPLPELPDELGVLAPNPSRNVQRGRKNAQAFRSFGAREIPQDNVLRTDVPRPGLRHAHRVRPGKQRLHNPPRNTRQNFPPHQQT